MIIEDEDVKTEIKFSDREQDTIDNPVQSWKNSEESQDDAYNLFSFDDEGDNDLEIQSFSFDFENKKEESDNDTFTRKYADEKPVEFSFTVNEPVNEPKTDFGQPKNEVETFTKTAEETAPKAQNIFEVKEEPKNITEPKTEMPRQTESEFTFVSKPADQERVMERRNKLKEFNSRYQNFDMANEFESVPAFKRKNISIDGSNASDQNINTYLSDNNGNMQIRENRFLNKDVD